jgi:hypothetical protein
MQEPVAAARLFGHCVACCQRFSCNPLNPTDSKVIVMGSNRVATTASGLETATQAEL